MFEEIDGVEPALLLLAAQQTGELDRNLEPLVRQPPQLVDLGQRLAVAEVVKEQDLEAPQKLLAEEGPLTRIAEIDGARLDVGADDARQTCRRHAGGRHGETVGETEEARRGALIVVGPDVRRREPLGESRQS